MGWLSRSPNPDVELAVEVLRSKGFRITTQKALAITAEHPDGMSVRLDLANLAARMHRTDVPAERRAIVDRFVGTIVNEFTRRTDRDQSWAASVRVILRPAEAVVSMIAQVPKDKQRADLLVYSGAGAGLAMIAVIDHPATMEYITSQHREDWGADDDLVMEEGFKNGWAAVERLSVSEISPGVFRASAGDCYDAGLILIRGVRERLEKAVGGPAVYAIPNREHLYAARESDRPAVQALAMLANELHSAGPYQITDAVVRVSEGGEIQEVELGQ